jgi:hypothetical protein
MDAIVKEPLHDLDRSRRFVDLLHQFDSSKQFELIEVVEMGLKPGVGTVFLGFDVIEGYGNSLLQYGLKSFASNRVIAESIKHLADLINYTFAPLLNAQGLFQEHELASYCRRSKVALQNLHPCFYEGGDLSRFRVVGVYLVENGPINAGTT